MATGRSDFPNHMDVSLVFPGFFRGLLDSGARHVRLRMMLQAAQALADMVPRDELHADNIVPRIFDFRVAPAIAEAVVRAAKSLAKRSERVCRVRWRLDAALCVRRAPDPGPLKRSQGGPKFT